MFDSVIKCIVFSESKIQQVFVEVYEVCSRAVWQFPMHRFQNNIIIFHFFGIKKS